MKKHKGQTRCPVCQLELSDMSTMRRHMVRRHGMAKKEVDRVTNKKRWPYHTGQGYAVACGLSVGEAPAAFVASPPTDGYDM